MEPFDKKAHWENVYDTKELPNVSWYQPVPETSLSFLRDLPFDARIIDVGGGDSFLTDHLLDLGYRNLTVLDISEKALERAKKRLGERAELVRWIVSDAAAFEPDQVYDCWHDRAAFHFLTGPNDVERYLRALSKGVKPDGLAVIGTFSENGPTKCSGIPIQQYSETSLTERLIPDFEKVSCFTVDHPTPFDTMQNFVFCSFRKKSDA